MIIKLEICCDNAAFADLPEEEVARILETAARRLRRDGLCDQRLTDINGNAVGELAVEGERPSDEPNYEEIVSGMTVSQVLSYFKEGELDDIFGDEWTEKDARHQLIEDLDNEDKSLKE